MLIVMFVRGEEKSDFIPLNSERFNLLQIAFEISPTPSLAARRPATSRESGANPRRKLSMNYLFSEIPACCIALSKTWCETR